MDKIVIALVLLLTFSGCRDKLPDRSKYQLELFPNTWLRIGLPSNDLTINYGQFHYRDVEIFTEREEHEIFDSFDDNKIYEVEGNHEYLNDTLIIMPPKDFKIRVLKTGSLQSEITIADNYGSLGQPSFGQSYQVVEFRESVLRILARNKKIKKALLEFKKYDSGLWHKYLDKGKHGSIY